MENERRSLSSEEVQALSEEPGKDTALCFASGYEVYQKFMLSCIGVLQAGRVGAIVSTMSGPAMMDARRDIVKGFLDLPAQMTHMLMVDSDMVFEPQDVQWAHETMERYGKTCGVVSGLYVDSNGVPVSGMWAENGGYEPLAKPPQEATRIDVAGCGFLLIRRDVLEALPEDEWFDHLPARGTLKRVLGEDASFCLRVADAGYSIYLDPDIFLGHIKTRKLYPDGTWTL